MNFRTAIEIIRDLNDLATADGFGNHTPDNPEYFRGQVELLVSLMGYEDDGYAERLFVLDRLGVNPTALTEKENAR